MFEGYPRWKRRPIFLRSRKVGKELEDLNISIYQLPSLLNRSKASGRKRKKGIIERVVRKGKKSLLISLQEGESKYHGKVWFLRHVGKTTRK